MTALALEVLNTPMGPYLNLMEEMTMEQKLALVAFLINTMQREDPKKKTSDEEFVKELMELRDREEILSASKTDRQLIPDTVLSLLGAGMPLTDDDLNGREAYYKHMEEKHQ